MDMSRTLPVASGVECDESALIMGLRTGDGDAWREAMRRCGGAMLAAARGITPEFAEDAVQEAWLSAHDAIRRFEGRAGLRTWLVRITMNKAYNQLRVRRREVSLDGLGEGDDGWGGAFDRGWRATYPQWSDDSPEALLQAQALQRCINLQLAALPSGQRMAITLHDIEGLPAREVCQTLDVTSGNFRVLLHRARMSVFAKVSRYQATGEV